MGSGFFAGGGTGPKAGRQASGEADMMTLFRKSFLLGMSVMLIWRPLTEASWLVS